MGIYRAVKVDDQSIVLVHEPESSQSHTIEIRNPKASYTPQIVEGKRYTVSLAVSEQSDGVYTAPVVPLPNTTENERQIAASEALSESTRDPERQGNVSSATEGVSPAGDSPEA